MTDKVIAFAEKFCVDIKLVRAELEHYEMLTLRCEKHKISRNRQKESKSREIEWQKLYEYRKVSSVKVAELDEYVKENNIKYMMIN